MNIIDFGSAAFLLCNITRYNFKELNFWLFENSIPQKRFFT